MPLIVRLVRFIRNYKWPLLWSLLLVFVSTGIGMVWPYIMGRVTDELGGFHKLSTAVQTAQRPMVGKFMLMVCVGMVVIYIVQALIGYIRSVLLLFVGNRIVFDIRQQIFRHIQRLSMRYFEQNPHGHIMARVMYDVEAVQAVLSGGIVEIISNTITLLVAIVLLYLLNWRMAVIATVILPLYVINFMMLRMRIRRAASDSREQYSAIYSILSEDISGIRVIKAFAREQREARRFVKEIRDSIDLNMTVGKLRTRLNINASLLTQFANVSILAWGTYQILYTGNLTMGGLITFTGYQGMLYGPVIALVTINDTINWVMAAVERIFETLDSIPDVMESKTPVRIRRLEGNVEMDHVQFSYEPGEPVLDDINVTAEPGKVTALVGPSGSGKTTLVQLIPRFYDPTSGVVRIDGHDLKDLSLTTLRRNIGMVMQENFLFMGTLRENIRYGRPDAGDDEVVQAAIAANAHDFITEFPEAYESRVGERGTRLSGGQRQRVAIARALITNPRILILDEATSDLDSESEALIQEALEYLMKGRTTFIIAHRLSTVMNADEILVLDHGKIVERGTHAELASAGGLYAELCEIQFTRAVRKMEEHQARLQEDRMNVPKAYVAVEDSGGPG
jgi:ABC-type multidrug transport system fused ATPase/permease subunit